jgi:AcrR family transcriptional regulator
MNEKKQLLVDTALQLFYEKGVNSVGINEVIKVSGVAKKTLYNHFSSKEALIIATLTVRDALFLSWLENQIKDATSQLDLVEKLFTALTAWFKNEVPELSHFRGCFFINTSAACALQSKEIEKLCSFHKTKVKLLIQKYLQTEDISFLDMICLLKEGAIIAAYVNHDVNAAKRCIPLITHYINGARKKGEH